MIIILEQLRFNFIVFSTLSRIKYLEKLVKVGLNLYFFLFFGNVADLVLNITDKEHDLLLIFFHLVMLAFYLIDFAT